MKIELVPVDQALQALRNDEPAYILIEINEDTTAAELNMADRYMVIRDAAPPEEKPKEKPAQKPKQPKQNKPKPNQPLRQIDHGKIIALTKAGWKCSAIASEMGCSEQTVRNHINMEANAIKRSETAQAEAGNE